MERNGPILVVEDEPGIADTIEYALTTEGFAVVRAGTARDAIKILHQGEAILAIVDVGLPDISGFDLCREIRTFSKMPLIFLTARSDAIDRIVGLELGADDYVAKPFHPRELAARVKAVLRRVPAAEDPAPQQQDAAKKIAGNQTPFEIDQQRHLISYFSAPLVLARYEFKILEVLISRPGWVFSRDKLMELAWDEPEMSLERTIDTHIKTIRARLREVKPDIEAIITHRGIGYSLREEW